jgi:hypothetical protein
MDWTFEFRLREGYVRIVTRGDFNVTDHQTMVESLLSDPKWRPGTPTLHDHRRLRFQDIGFNEMLEAKSIHVSNDARIGNGKAASLMRANGDFGIGRQYEILTTGRVSAQVRTFEDEAEAVAWLLDEAETS